MKKKNLEQRKTFELRGGNPSKFPANILSTVSSSRGIACSAKRICLFFLKVLYLHSWLGGLLGALACHRLSFSRDVWINGFGGAELCITIALWGFVVVTLLGHWQGNIQQLVEKY